MLGPYRDIPAPDMNTNARVMAWVLDEYSVRKGYSPAVVTGKPVALGGSLGREEATGRGVVYIMQEYARDSGIPIKGGRVVVQGFGNVGAHFSRLLHELGAKIVAVSDVDGALYNEGGLDIPKLFEHGYVERKSVGEFPGGDRITNDQLLTIPCEWLVPAALGAVINKEENAATIDCKVVVEAANSPVTPIADKILEERGITVLPDFLVNAGGVVVSLLRMGSESPATSLDPRAGEPDVTHQDGHRLQRCSRYRPGKRSTLKNGCLCHRAQTGRRGRAASRTLIPSPLPSSARTS